MKQTVLQVIIVAVAAWELSDVAVGQLPEIIGRSKNGQQSGGLIIEPGKSRSRISSQSDTSSTGTVSRNAAVAEGDDQTPLSNVNRHLEWFAILFEGKAVGYESVSTTFNTSALGTSRIRRQRDTRLKLKRFGSDLSVSAVLETEESSDGLLYGWSLRRTGAEGARLERSAQWNVERMGYEVSETVAGIVKQQFIPATVQPRSPIMTGWIASTAHSPEDRWGAAVLFPETNSIADIDIAGQGSQRLALPTGKSLVINRFDYWPSESPGSKSSVYYDADGAVVRIEQPLLGKTLTLERSETASALGQQTLDALDLEFNVLLPMIRPIPKNEARISLTLKFIAGPSEQLELPTTEFQSIDRGPAGEVFVTLTPPVIQKKEERIARPPKMRLDSEFTKPSRWITSDNESVRRMGVMVAGNSVLPEDKCLRLTDAVFEKMKNSAFSTSLVPASDVIRNLRGDCTEHAVLLAALMRSQGVPTRVAIGFVHVPNPASFAPHMWTEAFIDEKWVPFDATRGSRGIGMTHVKVGDSSLSDDVASGTILFVQLLPFLGRTTVDYIPQSEFSVKP